MPEDQEPKNGLDMRSPAERKLPVVFSSPHSGRDYPEAFLRASRLTKENLRRSEDFLIDRIFADAPACGAPFLCARFPRAYIDVNREAYELDPAMFDAPLPSHVNTDSPRVAGGLGTIARIVGAGETIYRTQLSYGEVEERIQRFYHPYHAKLRALVAETQKAFGHALLIDCHSMPSRASDRADIVLGDRYGASAAPQLTEAVSEILRGMGYRVARNEPYAGGFITTHYGRPKEGIHALQIEINRLLYMDETRLAPTDGLPRVARDMRTLMGLLGGRLGEMNTSILYAEGKKG